MKILLIILLLLFANKSYALGGKVYKIQLDNDDWIKVIPHVYPTTDWTGAKWFCGAQSYVTTTWGDDYRPKKKLLMGVKLSNENKLKHLKTFELFLRNYKEQLNPSARCPQGQSTDLETWVDYKNKTMGVFKVIQYDNLGCMIFQSLIQIKKNIRTNVAMVCQRSHGTFYDFLTVPRYFKIDVDSFKRLNN